MNVQENNTPCLPAYDAQNLQLTEIGLLPKDWEVKAIDTFAEIKTGSKNTENKVESGIYPFFVRSQKVERINTFACDEEAILTAGDGVGVGKVFHYVNGKFDYHQRVYKIGNFQPLQVYGKYFFEYFKHNFFKEVMKYTAKSSVDSVRMDMIAKMLIPLPPLPEQLRIAEVLEAQDALISRQEEAIEKQKMLKQAAMQELLQPKEGWEMRKLEDIADIIDPHPSHRAPKEELIGIPFAGIGDFNEKGDIINEKVRIVSKDIFNEHSQRYNIDNELIGLGRVASIGKVIKFKRLTYKFTISPTMGVIQVNKELCKRNFMYFILQTTIVKEQFNQIMNGSTRSSVGMIVLRKLNIPLPPIEEQTRIAAILSDIDAEIEAMEAVLAKQRALKEGLMQELLTGRKRLV